MKEEGGNQIQRHDRKEDREDGEDEGERGDRNDTRGSSENSSVEDFERYNGWEVEEEDQSQYMQKMHDKSRRKTERGVETLRNLLEKMNHRPIGTDLLIAAAKDKSGFPDLFALLVRHNGTLAVKEDVILAVARNPYGYRMMEFFLDYRKDLPITQEVLTAAVAIDDEDFSELMQVDRSWKLVLEALLQHVPHINIGDEIFQAAAKNSEIGVELVALFLKHRPLRVTEAVLSAAAENKRCGTRIVTMLLHHQSNIDVTVNVLGAAFANEECGANIVKKLLEYRSIEITDDVIEAVLQRVDKSVNTKRVLLAHGSGSDIPEETIAQARERMNTPDFVDLLLRFKSDIATNLHQEKNTHLNGLSTKIGQNIAQNISTNCLICLGFDPNLFVPKDIHKFFWDDILHTSQAGCRICILMKRCIDRIREELETGLRLDRRIYLSRTTRGFLSLDINGLHFEVYRHAGKYRYQQHIIGNIQQTNKALCRFTRLLCEYRNWT
jgi:hypothetical protein